MKKEIKNVMSLEEFEKELEERLEMLKNGECMVYSIICFLEENIKIAKIWHFRAFYTMYSHKCKCWECRADFDRFGSGIGRFGKEITNKMTQGYLSIPLDGPDGDALPLNFGGFFEQFKMGGDE